MPVATAVPAGAVPPAGPIGGGGRRNHLLRTLVVPVVGAAVAVAVAASAGHLLVGVLLGVGLFLGAANGLMAESYASRLTPEADPSRKMIMTGSLRRLGGVTLVALLVAWLARPLGWVLLLGLAFYQLLSLATALGAAAQAARQATRP